MTGLTDAPAITESLPLGPLTPYGATKAAGEMLMSAYTAVYGVRCAVLRLTNVYGPGMQAKDSIVARLMRVIRLGNTFEVYGDGTQVRDYVHSLDVSAAMREALSSEVWSGPMVIGSGRSLSVLDVVEAAVSAVEALPLPACTAAAAIGMAAAAIGMAEAAIGMAAAATNTSYCPGFGVGPLHDATPSSSEGKTFSRRG